MVTRLRWFGVVAVLIMLWTRPARAQQGVVAGVVVDNAGAPAAGAVVSLRGGSLSTRTSAEGRFELRGLSGGAVTLVVRLIPFRPLETTVAVGRTDLRLELSRMAVTLDDIVITGTAGEGQQRREIANAVATVRVTEQLESAPVLSIGQLINARAPGVQVTPPGGLVGGGERIMIRGRSSLSLRLTPLIYVDGVRVDDRSPVGGSGTGSTSRMNDFNPDDIESIEIIKGPAAATLYGTEASSGVVQIITRRGKPGATQVQLSTRTGAAFVADPEGRWPINYYREPNGEVVEFNIAEQETNRGTPLFRTGLLQGYSLGVSGGGEGAQYFAAAHYDDDQGAIGSNWSKKYGARLNLNVSPRTAWDANIQLGFNTLRTSFPNSNYIFGTVLSRPQVRDLAQRGFFTAPSEIWEREFELLENVDRLTTGGELRHRPAAWLSHRLKLGLDLSRTDAISLTRRMGAESSVFFSPAQAQGQKSFNQRGLVSTTVDYSATATRELGSALQVSATAGGQYYRQDLTTLTASGQIFPSSDITSIVGAATRLGGDDQVENVSVGVFGQLQLAWKNRFFLTGALRGDDNSAFGQEFDFVTYPKVSASWVVSEEPFWGIRQIDNFRIRAAWGESGQQPQSFAALRTYQPITGQAGQAAVTPQFVGNPELGPERSREIEVGLDASFFNQRVGVDFTFYTQTTRDAILLRDVAPSSGFPQQQYVNAGTVQNRGFELLLDGRIIESRNFGWEVGLNLSRNANQVLDIGLLGTPYLSFGYGNRFQPGFPVYGIFSRKVISADRGPNGAPINILCDGGTPDGHPSGQGVPCGTAPRVYIGQVDPKIDGAVSSTIRIKQRLAISGLLDFKRGQRNWTSSLWCPGILGCEEEIYPERADPVKAASSVLGYTDDAEWWRDMSFVKLREVSVNYQLPDTWARRFGANRAAVSLAGRNLHTWTKFEGLDPESYGAFAETGGGTPFEQNEVPQLRQFVLRINLTF